MQQQRHQKKSTQEKEREGERRQIKGRVEIASQEKKQIQKTGRGKVYGQKIKKQTEKRRTRRKKENRKKSGTGERREAQKESEETRKHAYSLRYRYLRSGRFKLEDTQPDQITKEIKLWQEM